MSSFADANSYEDVFVLGGLVYALEWKLRVVHVYNNRNNSLIKLRDVRCFCECGDRLFIHSIVVTNEHIITSCSRGRLVYISDSFGELLRKISIADICDHFLYLNQVDTERNFLVVDSGTNRLLIAHADQPRSHWRVVRLAGFPGRIRFWGAVWFRRRLYVAGRNGELLTFAPVDGSRSWSTAHAQT